MGIGLRRRSTASESTPGRRRRSAGDDAVAPGDLEALEREADSRLYAAKAAGRDRVVTG